MNPKNEEKKLEIYNYINSYIERMGVCPSTNEIAEAMKCAKSTVSKFVNRLLDEGFLERYGRNQLRTKQNMFSAYSMPIVGSIACGKPILAVEDIEGYIPVDKASLGHGEYFGLIAEGESMIEAGIFPGDVVYIKKQESAENGQIVVAMLEDEFGDGERATLKRFFKDYKNRRYILHPENSDMDDIVVDNVRILGVAVRVLRDLT